MKKMLRSVLCILVLSLPLAACGKKSEPAAPSQAPTAATTSAVPAPAPAAPEAPPPPPAAAPPASYAGEWKGDSGPDLPLSFTVEGNQITSFNPSYSGKIGTCSVNGSIGNDGPATINGNSFTVHGKHDRGPIEFNLTGTFTSPTEASGNVTWKGKSEICGDINLQYKWTAKKSAETALD